MLQELGLLQQETVQPQVEHQQVCGSGARAGGCQHRQVNGWDVLSLKIKFQKFIQRNKNLFFSFIIETRLFLHSKFLKDDKAFV